jgi:prepilin-type N-terminal cleavage/methylation domain-containing protein
MIASRGFSLIEVVISLFVIGVTIALTTTMLTLMPLSRHAKDQSLALSIAANEVEGLRALGYASLPASGSFSDAQLALLPQGSGALSVTDFNARTKQVEVTVSWQENASAASSSIALTTLITDVGGL